jgi:hypothetical protein
MKVLILTDEAYKQVAASLKRPARNGPKLPDAEELHRLARAGETPEAFALARERSEAVNAARVQMREQMHELILAADAVGIGPGKLSQWSGYTDRHINTLTRGRSDR